MATEDVCCICGKDTDGGVLWCWNCHDEMQREGAAMRPDDEMSVHGGEDDYMLPCPPPEDVGTVRHMVLCWCGVLAFCTVCWYGVWRLVAWIWGMR
jgi:hypothetical protein